MNTFWYKEISVCAIKTMSWECERAYKRHTYDMLIISFKELMQTKHRRKQRRHAMRKGCHVPQYSPLWKGLLHRWLRFLDNHLCEQLQYYEPLGGYAGPPAEILWQLRARHLQYCYPPGWVSISSGWDFRTSNCYADVRIAPPEWVRHRQRWGF